MFKLWKSWLETLSWLLMTAAMTDTDRDCSLLTEMSSRPRVKVIKPGQYRMPSAVGSKNTLCVRCVHMDTRGETLSWCKVLREEVACFSPTVHCKFCFICMDCFLKKLSQWSTLKVELGHQDGSVDRDAYLWALWPESELQESGGQERLTPIGCFLVSMCAPWHAHTCT